MRWRILGVLLRKEAARHGANKGGLAFAALLVGASLLLGAFRTEQAGGGGGTSLVGGVHHVALDADRDARGPWYDHMKANVPEALSGQILFRAYGETGTGVGIIRVRRDGAGALAVSFFAPDGRTDLLAPYEAWFWSEARRFLLSRTNNPDAESDGGTLGLANDAFARLHQNARDAGDPDPPLFRFDRPAMAAGKLLDPRVAILMAMVIFAFYFSCVYTLAALTCEERERGVLLAQALSPASPLEIVAAKALFYPAAGVLLAALLVGAFRPALLMSGYLWGGFAALAAGFVGVGLCVASLARTQRAASMGAMLYALSVALLIMVCQQGNVVLLPYLFIEFHGPRVVHAALTGEPTFPDWLHLAALAILGVVWLAAGWKLFRERGWR